MGMGKESDLENVVVLPLQLLCPTLCNSMDYSRPGSFVLHYLLSLLKFMPTESVLVLCHRLLLLPSMAFLMRWPMYWSFSISPSNEYSGLIFFRIDQFDFIAVQGTLKSLLQHHNSKASGLWCSVFLRIQLSYHYLVSFFLPFLFFPSLLPFLLPSLPPPSLTSSLPSFLPSFPILVSSSAAGLQSRIRSSDT